MTGIRTKNRPHEPRKRAVQQRSRLTVEAIVEAAAHIFEQHGYVDTTTDLIAARAGVSIGSLYQYFPNKDALLVALFERHLEEVERHFTALQETLQERAPLEDLVLEMVRRVFAIHRASPELHRIFIEEAPFPRRLLDAYAEKEQRLRKAWVAYLSGEVDDPDLAALMTRHLLEALAHRHTLYPPPDRTPAELESATVRMIVAYLEAERRTHTR